MCFVVFVACACLACPLVFGSFASCSCLRLRFACWLRLRLLLWLGLLSRPVFGACGCFALAVLPVAVSVFRPCPALSVVCVAEVPLVCGRDWLSAFGAGVCFACGQSCLPCPAEVAVCRIVSSCCRAAALPLVCVCVDGAEACALFDELWAIVPGASTEAHVVLPSSMVRVVCGVRHVLGTSPAKFPRLATAIYGLPARLVSPPRSASFFTSAPKVFAWLHAGQNQL